MQNEKYNLQKKLEMTMMMVDASTSHGHNTSFCSNRRGGGVNFHD